MIEKLDLNDGRYKVILEKVNEIVDVVNALDKQTQTIVLDFDNHTHDVLIGSPEFFDSLRHSTGPLVTMVNETNDNL